MAKLSFTGLDEYIERLNRLGKDSEKLAGKAVYQGAKIVADEMRNAIDALPTDEKFGAQAKPAKGISQRQKQGLLEGFGVAPMANDRGFIHVKLGFHGVNDIRTKAHPGGQPNHVIASAAESGTSFCRKTPFMRKAVAKSKALAEEKMKETLEQEIERIIQEE